MTRSSAILKLGLMTSSRLFGVAQTRLSCNHSQKLEAVKQAQDSQPHGCPAPRAGCRA